MCLGWYVLLGALAAYGALSALWAAFGWLLPGLRGCTLVCIGLPEEGARRRYRWLRGLGLLECPFLAVTEEETEETEACSADQLLARLTREAERFGGTGT